MGTTVPRLWPGQMVACVAGGPSLLDSDLAALQLEQIPTIAVNNAWQRVPWADVLYAADRDWWQWQAQEGVTDEQLPPHLFGMDPLAVEYRPKLVCLKRGADDGLCRSPDALASGGHSGYQAINLACHLIDWHGTILLLGYDMQPGPNGQHHWHVDHPNGRHVNYRARLPAYATLAAAAARYPQLSIINASRSTAITVFPRQFLTETVH